MTHNNLPLLPAVTLVLYTLLVLVRICSTVTPYGAWQSGGKASFYGGNSAGGTCEFRAGILDSTTSFPYTHYAAADISLSGRECGRCFEITAHGPYTTPNPGCIVNTGVNMTVVIADKCAECPAFHFDLNDMSLLSSNPGTCGELDISYRPIACEANGNIIIRSKTGVSPYWYGVHVLNVAGVGALSAVYLRPNNVAEYQLTTLMAGAGEHYVLDDASIEPYLTPMDVKLVNANGDELVALDLITNLDLADTEFDFGSNFPVTLSPSAPTTTPAVITLSPSLSSSVITAAPTQTAISGNIVITNHADSTQWWFSVFVTNIACGAVSQVEIRKSIGYPEWTAPIETAANWFAWDNNGNSFNATVDPISVRLTNTNGEVLTLNHVINDVMGSVVTDLGANFACSPSTDETTTDEPIIVADTDTTTTDAVLVIETTAMHAMNSTAQLQCTTTSLAECLSMMKFDFFRGSTSLSSENNVMNAGECLYCCTVERSDPSPSAATNYCAGKSDGYVGSDLTVQQFVSDCLRCVCATLQIADSCTCDVFGGQNTQSHGCPDTSLPSDATQHETGFVASLLLLCLMAIHFAFKQ